MSDLMTVDQAAYRLATDAPFRLWGEPYTHLC
jgi:hypothetical protein